MNTFRTISKVNFQNFIPPPPPHARALVLSDTNATKHVGMESFAED